MPKSLRVSYAAPVYGSREIRAVNAVLKDPLRLVSGHRVKEFERRIARLFGKSHGVMVNSGSSANLIAFEALNLPAGSEVITPILTFSTTLAPIIQKGLVPVFADVKPGSYLIDIDQIESLISKKTRALMIPSLLGNIPDMARLERIAKKHNLRFIEDSCDTIGGTFAEKPTGAYSDVSTTSFYASHVITAAAGGGMACFRDGKIAERALVLSNWGRQSTLFGVYEKSEDIKKRFAGVLDGEAYDAKFIFSEVGYNFQSDEIHAAFGLEQLKRLPGFSRKRRNHFGNLMNFFRKHDRWFTLPVQHAKVKTNWLAFPLTLKAKTPFTRHQLTRFLEERDIQTRPIFTGNVLRQPAFSKLSRAGLRSQGYPVADYIMRNGFVIGCHQGLTATHMAYIKKTFTEFFEQYF
ncbi:MAG: aminotransferase class I/II-fold pyridoxal phosphate-dependent enzyme [bacterium]|nr:aminotransferase class I/II-fold pyridoxal phosphate-dependent enzyme [bacterium]